MANPSTQVPEGKAPPDGRRRPSRLPGPWSLRTRILVVVAALAAFIMWYLAAAPSVGRGAAAPSAFFVLTAGYVLGIRFGIIAGLAVMPLTWALAPVVGLGDEPIDMQGGAFYATIMASLGAGGGWVGRLQGRAEAARAEADRLAGELDQAQHIAGLGYWSIAKSGHLEWSDVLWKAYGFTEEPYQVEEAFARIHPDDEPRVRAHIEAMWQGGAHVEDEHKVLLPDGSVRWIAYTCDAERDTDGAVLRVIGTGQDITDRKRAEATSDRFRDLLNRLEDVYWVGDPINDRFVFSGAVERMFGVSAKELSVDPSKMAQIVHPDDLKATMVSIGRVAAGKASTVTFRMIRPDGTVRHIISHAWPIQGDDQFTAYGIMRDVTAEREVVRLEELDEMKALFMNAAAHELNTPLTPLKLQVALLEKDHPDNATVAVIKRNVERMEVLVKDLLDASRLQAGRLKFAMQADLDVSAVLADVCRGAALQAKAKDIKWTQDLGEGLLAPGDPVRLAQVFNNIANNAIKFTAEDGAITVQAAREGDHIVVRFQDTGLGLETDQIAGLFKPFAQFHRGDTGAHKGTGLGLYISKQIIDQHNGTIEASSPGREQGATFTVRVPAAG